MIQNHQLSEFPKEFNFWQGVWKTRWKYYLEDGSGHEISETIHRVFSILNGKVLVETAEENGEIDDPKIICGISLRYFNSSEQQWVMIQVWPGKEQASMGTLTGEFDRRRCEMKNTYEIEGTKYLQKYTFSDITENYFRWDRQVSADDGLTWRLSMKLHFDRLQEPLEAIHQNTLFSYYGGKLAAADLKMPLPVGPGTVVWHAENRDREGQVEIYDAIGGFGKLLYIHDFEEDMTEELYFFNYDTTAQHWNLVVFDNKPESDHTAFINRDDTWTFEPHEEFTRLSHGQLKTYSVRVKSGQKQVELQHIKNGVIIKNYTISLD